MSTKAGCLLWIEHNGQIMILTGKESSYLSDIHSELVYKGKPVLIESLQQYTSGDYTSVKQNYGAITQRLETENTIVGQRITGQRIQFDTPEKRGDNQYHCNFRVLTESSARGICKGGVNPGETTKDAAKREVAEETGMNLSRTSMTQLGVFLGCEMFQSNLGTILPTPLKSYEEVLARIESREIKKYGELFEVSLIPLDTVIEWVCDSQYNAVSRESICAFVRSSGTEEQKAIINRGLGRGRKSRRTKGKRRSKGKQTRSKK